MLKKTVIHFINTINVACCRTAEQGTNLLKNHLFFHIEIYIEYYGPPKGFDPGPSESNHKMAVKAPSKTTQGSASLLTEQTGNGIMKNNHLNRVVNHFGKQKMIAPKQKIKLLAHYSR